MPSILSLNIKNIKLAKQKAFVVK